MISKLRSALGMLLLGILYSCGDSTIEGPGPVHTSTLTVIVKDSAGIPINGAQVVTYPSTIGLVTDQYGIAEFTELPRQQYQVVVSRSDIPVFYQNIYLSAKPLTIQFTIALEVTINLSVKYISGAPLDSTEISTSPPTSVVFTNTTGGARMENVPVKAYTFIIKRGQSIAYVKNKMISIRNGVIQDLDLIVDTQPPFVTIMQPTANYYHSIFDITFAAEGLDFEDGVLPFDSFEWYSSIDGFLGRGREILVERMSVGNHYVTVIGTDSDGNKNQRSISMTLFFYSKDSYFPIPPLGYWEYTNLPRSFILTDNQGAARKYTLYDMHATMEQVNARKCSMLYLLDDAEGQKWYQYSVIDYYDNDIDEFFVIKTVEVLEFWKTISSGEQPFSKVTIETVYQEKYPLFRDHLNISENDNFSFETMAEVSWLFEGISYGTQKYRERMPVESQTSFEGYETLTTPLGTFDTARLHVKQGQTERTWWLARGWGIVQLAYNTFGTPVVSTLFGSNLGDMVFDSLTTVGEKPAMTNSPQMSGSGSGAPPSQELRDLVNMFREMAPR